MIRKLEFVAKTQFLTETILLPSSTSFKPGGKQIYFFVYEKFKTFPQ